jgi:hypothetical protein
MIGPSERFDSSDTAPSPYPANGVVDKEKWKKRQNRQFDLGDFGVLGKSRALRAGFARNPKENERHARRATKVL